MSIAQKLEKLIIQRKEIEDEIDYKTNPIIQKMVQLLTSNPSQVDLFLKTECSEEQFVWISEILDEIVEKTNKTCFLESYLKAYYPEAYEQFIAREDHMDLLKKYHVYCHEHMSLLLEILRNEAGFCSRKVLAEGLQQDLYDFIIKKTKEFVFDELTDLLAEAGWMSA